MSDKRGQITIPKEFRDSYLAKGQVYVYYSEKSKLFFLMPEDLSHLYNVAIRKVDKKGRFYVPDVVIKIYDTKKLLIASKERILYILPVKED